MGPFMEAWQSSREEKALKAVEKLEDQQKLMEVAKYAPLPSVQIRAIEKISHPPYLGEVVKQFACDAAFRLEPAGQKALEMLGSMAHAFLDPQTLGRLAKMSILDVQGISDQVLLREITTASPFWALQLAAFRKLESKNASLLAGIKKNYEEARQARLRMHHIDLGSHEDRYSSDCVMHIDERSHRDIAQEADFPPFHLKE